MSDISIIIPAYNVAEYLGDALESVIRQDPPFKQIIVVDDGSTDGTADLVASFKDPRIVCRHQENRGLGPARNAGMGLADGEYLYFMDGDDVLADGFTRFIQDALQGYGTSPDMLCFSATNFMHGSGKPVDSKYFQWLCAGDYATGRQAMVAAMSSGCFPVCAFTYVARREVVERPPKLRFRDILHEDELFTPELLLRCNRTVICNRPLYLRRMRKGSIMHTRKTAENIAGNLAAARFWQELVGTASADEKPLFQIRAYNFYRGAIRGAAKARLGWDELASLIRESGFDCEGFARRDYRLAKVNRHLASAVIRRRSRRRVRDAR